MNASQLVCLASVASVASVVGLVALTSGGCNVGGSTFTTITITPTATDGGVVLGVGEIVSDPVGIDCLVAADGTPSGACEATFDAELEITLTARPTAPATFAGWVDTAGGDNFTYEEGAGFAGSGKTTNPISFSSDSGRTLQMSATFTVPSASGAADDGGADASP